MRANNKTALPFLNLFLPLPFLLFLPFPLCFLLLFLVLWLLLLVLVLSSLRCGTDSSLNIMSDIEPLFLDITEEEELSCSSISPWIPSPIFLVEKDVKKYSLSLSPNLGRRTGENPTMVPYGVSYGCALFSIILSMMSSVRIWFP